MSGDRSRIAEIDAHPDRFMRWRLEDLSLEALSSICEFLRLPFRNTVFVDNATTGTYSTYTVHIHSRVQYSTSSLSESYSTSMFFRMKCVTYLFGKFS